MAEPLSIATSVLAVASATLTTIQNVKHTIDTLVDVPSSLVELQADLNALEPALASLSELTASQQQHALPSGGLILAVENCRDACDGFQIQLDRWKRRSKNDKTFWVDRWKVALFGQKRIETLRARLLSCKLTLTMNTTTMLA